MGIFKICLRKLWNYVRQISRLYFIWILAWFLNGILRNWQNFVQGAKNLSGLCTYVKENKIKATKGAPQRFAWMREWAFLVAWMRENRKKIARMRESALLFAWTREFSLFTQICANFPDFPKNRVCVNFEKNLRECVNFENFLRECVNFGSAGGLY